MGVMKIEKSWLGVETKCTFNVTQWGRNVHIVDALNSCMYMPRTDSVWSRRLTGDPAGPFWFRMCVPTSASDNKRGWLPGGRAP